MGVVGNLSSEQVEFFNSQGYLVVESFASQEDVEALRKRMDELLEEFEPSGNSAVFYRTFSGKGSKEATDYFFGSAENISFFFEEKAFDENGNSIKPKQLAIKRVGHALHEYDPEFKKFSTPEKMSGLFYSLGYKRPVVIQSVYIFKQPQIGAEVAPHQDGALLRTKPASCVGLWLALEDATLTNGCLWALPGSHKNGLLMKMFRDENGIHFDKKFPSFDQKDFVPLEVKAGSIILIHGDLVHQSLENHSSKSRHAYTLHVVETDGCKWEEDNWIRRKVEPEPLYTLRNDYSEGAKFLN